MKKLLYLLMFVFPIAVYAQQPGTNLHHWIICGRMLEIQAFQQEEPITKVLPLALPVSLMLLFGLWKCTKATVMKFDGSNWVNVGNAGFSAGEA